MDISYKGKGQLPANIESPKGRKEFAPGSSYRGAVVTVDPNSDWGLSPEQTAQQGKVANRRMVDELVGNTRDLYQPGIAAGKDIYNTTVETARQLAQEQLGIRGQQLDQDFNDSLRRAKAERQMNQPDEWRDAANDSAEQMYLQSQAKSQFDRINNERDRDHAKTFDTNNQLAQAGRSGYGVQSKAGDFNVQLANIGVPQLQRRTSRDNSTRQALMNAYVDY